MLSAKTYLIEHRSKFPILHSDPDHYFVSPSETGSISIESIRELREWAALKPFVKSPKIALIQNIQSATNEAQNALLKLLEEPPSETIIILHVNDQENLLPTIVSRCERVSSLSPIEELFTWQTPYSYFHSITDDDLLSLTSLLSNNHFSPASIILAAEKYQSSERSALVGILDELLRQLHNSPSKETDLPRYAVISRALLEAKKELLDNANIRLVIENLLFSVYSK